jgi:hypothetical protein
MKWGQILCAVALCRLKTCPVNLWENRMCHHGVPSYVLSLCNTTLDTTVETWKSSIGNLEAIIGMNSFHFLSKFSNLFLPSAFVQFVSLQIHKSKLITSFNSDAVHLVFDTS